MGFELVTPCLFGLEGLVGDELRRLDMENVRVENGRVLFSGGAFDLARANLCLRTGERVLLQAGETEADSFDRLYEGVRAMPWEAYIPKDGAFPVKGHALNSKLHSVPDCQSIVKKAIVDRLAAKYGLTWLPETGAVYQVRFSIMNDLASLSLDTSGTGLHKRGYRPVGNAAPLRETLAAAMVTLARYRGRDALCDPFCGSGTIPIEAALAALNRAPGLNRAFAAEAWPCVGQTAWTEAKTFARDREFRGQYDIWGGDVDPKSIEIARQNARRAGVDAYLRFEEADARQFAPAAPAGVVVTNPPYGERVMDKEAAERLYTGFGRAVRALSGWKLYILSSHTEFERVFGKTADKKRKLYNGMIKSDLFMYLR